MLTHEQDASLGERYVSSSPHAATVRGLMGASVLNSESPSATNPSLSPAGAAEPEADSPEHVAAVSLPVVTAQSDTADSDGVEHARQSRLSRLQAQR